MKAILTYHSIDPSGSVVSVHPDRFREHVDILVRGDVPVVPLTTLLQPTCVTGVALTFDDGFVNFASVAWPLLKSYELPVTLYVPTDWVGRENAWDPSDGRIPRLPLLDWRGLRGLADQGVEMGSHSRTHPRLTTLGVPELEAEVRASRTALAAELGCEPTSFAYPYGDYDADVCAAVRRAGYGNAVTTELRLLDSREGDLFELPRLDAFYLARPGVMERWGTSEFRRHLRFRGAARRARQFLSRSISRRQA